MSTQPAKRPPPRASSRGALGSQGLPRGSAWSRGVTLLQGQQGQSAGFCTFPDFQTDRSPSEEGLRSLLSIWGSQPPEAVDPRDDASTSVSDGSPHPATADSTPQIWPKTLWGVKASGFLTRPLLPASRRRRGL